MSYKNYIDDSNKTLPDYQNFRNVLFHQWEELNNASVELRCCVKQEYTVYKINFIRCYLKFYGQINHKNKLNHIKQQHNDYLKKYYNNPSLINKNIALNIIRITRYLMESFGVFDIGTGGGDEIW